MSIWGVFGQSEPDILTTIAYLGGPGGERYYSQGQEEVGRGAGGIESFPDELSDYGHHGVFFFFYSNLYLSW